MALDALLSDQEIDELDAFLASEARPQECMDITVTRRPSHRGGRPRSSASSRWLPVIWGGKSDPVVESANKRTELVKPRHAAHEHDRAMLCKAPPAIRADTLRRRGGGGGTIVVAHDWCAGFLPGLSLHSTIGSAPGRQKSNSVFLVPACKAGDRRGS